MQIQRIILCATIGFAAIPSCLGTAQDTTIPVDGYAAIVNDRIIMVSDIMASVTPLQQKWSALYAGEELQERMQQAYNETLQSLVARALIIEEFEAREGTIPERIVSDQMDETIRDQFNNDRVQLMRELTDMQMTHEDWREQVREQIIVTMLRREEVLDKVSVSPLDVRNLYEERLADYTREEQVKLRMISLHKGESEEEHQAKLKLAKTLRERIIFGENFSALAREFSEGSKAARGGDWGWINPANLRGEITETAIVIEPGKISEVIRTDDHFYLIVVEGRKAADVTPLEDVSEELEEELRREQIDELFNNWIAKLREKHYVKVFSP